MLRHKVSITKLSALLRPGFKWTLLFGLWAGLMSCAQKPHPSAKNISQPQQKSDESFSNGNASSWESLPKDPYQDLIEQKISQLTLEEKVGQLLVIGFPGKTLSPQALRLIEQIHPGSVILFSRNIKNYQQLHTLTRKLQDHSQKVTHLPLLIMLDEEGGVVTRVRVGSTLPSALALAQTKNPSFIRSYSKNLGALLNRLGINMNLAPVLDVSNPNASSFIGSRSFGQSPEEVAELGTSFALGQWDSGVIPTAKHFPGHGGLQTDSHKATPVKNLTLPELLQTDALPFHSFARMTIPSAMMLGHVSFPKIDPTGYPAAFSQKLNQGLLRDELNFHGLAITDDLEMAGAEKVGDISERTIQAVLAGNDMIMVAWSLNRQLQAYKTLLAAVWSGRISERRLNQSLRRIIYAKLLMQEKTLAYQPVEIERLRKKLITQVRDVKKLSFQSALQTKEGRSVLPQLPSSIEVYSSDRRFYENFQKSFMKASRWFPLSKSNVEDRIVRLNMKSEAEPFVFYVSGTGTARWLDQLNPVQKRAAIVINTNEPGAIKNPDDFLKVVQLNSSSPESGWWLAEYLNQQGTLRQPSNSTGPLFQPQEH